MGQGYYVPNPFVCAVRISQTARQRGTYQSRGVQELVLSRGKFALRKHASQEFLPLVSREWKNGSKCTPFLHSLLTKGKNCRCRDENLSDTSWNKLFRLCRKLPLAPPKPTFLRSYI